MRKLMLAILCAPLFAGCAGGFRSEASFQEYVANLHLAEMSPENAANRLSQDGFKCDANSDPRLHPLPSTYCRKSWDTGPIYQIWIQPSKVDPSKSIVEPSSVWVVA